MAVEISQLRIVGDYDASAYEAGARKKVAADKGMVASDREVAESANKAGAAQKQAANDAAAAAEKRAKASAAATTGEKQHGDAIAVTARTLERYAAAGAGAARLDAQLEQAKVKLARVERDAATAIQNDVSMRAVAIRAIEAHRNNVARLEAALERQIRIERAAGAQSSAMGAEIAKLSPYMANLAAQANDVAVSLMSGQKPWMVMIQQGSQVQGIFQQAGVALRAFVNPLTVGIAAAATFGAGLAVVVGRAIDLERQLRSLKIALDATGGASGLSAGEVQARVIGFAKTPGVDRTTAADAATQILRNPLINGDMFARVLPLARDFAAITGQEIPAAAKALADGLTGGYQAALKLDQQFQFLTTIELTLIRTLEEQGRKTEAANIVLAAMERHTKGVADQGVLPLDAALKDLSNTWNGLLDGLAKSEAFEEAKRRLKELVDIASGKSAGGGVTGTLGANPLTGPYAAIANVSGLLARVFGARPAADVQPLRALDYFGEDPQKIESDAGRIATAMQQIGSSGGPSKGALHALGVEADALARSLNPAAEEMKRLENQQVLLLNAFLNGKIGVEQYIGAMQMLGLAMQNVQTPENLLAGLQRQAKLAGMAPGARAGEEAAERLRQAGGSQEQQDEARRLGTQAYTIGQSVGSGISIGKRIQEAEAEARLEAKFSAQIAEASKQGAAAVADMELRLKAAKKAQELYGEAAGKSGDAVQRLADKLYALDKAAQHDKFVAEFRLATEEIERANTVLEAEVRLINATPEARAKEIAALKVRNDLLAKGESIGAEDYQRRLDAVTAQEEMNRKLEEAKKQQEAMAEPFKNAIQSLQSYIVDGLTGGFENAGQAIRGIWKRLMAELAVATVIRPIIVQPVVSLLGSLGLVPQSVTSQYGGGPLGGILGGGGSGGGLGSILGGGNGGGFLGGLGGFFSRPLFGGNNPVFGGAPLGGWGSSFGGLDASAFNGVIEGMSGAETAGYLNSLTGTGSIAGALGSIAGIGMGAMSLAQGNAIGGISGILGGGLGLVGALAPSLGFLGPIGLGIGLIGGILGGLLKKKPKTPQEVSNITFGGGGIFNALAMSRGKSLGSTGPASDAFGGAFSGLLDQYGLSMADNALGGWILNSIGKKTGNQFIVGLGSYGSYTPLPDGKAGSSISGIASAEDAVNILAGLIAKRAAQDNTIVGLTGTQRTALTNADLKSIEDIKKALDFSQVYDDIVRGQDNITAAEKAIRDLNTQFRALSAQAKDYGLDIATIDQRRQEAVNKLATDMNDDYRRRLLGMTPEGALQVSLEDLEKARVAAIKEAEYLNTQVTGALADINQIEEFYAKQRVQIIEQANAEANSALKEIWKRLSYGDLSGASPMTTLSGARGTYEATLAQANAGSLTARGNLAGAVQDYIAAQLRYTGNDSQFEAVRLKLLADIAPYVADNSNFLTSANDNITEASNLMLSQQYQIQNLTTALAESRQQFADAMTQITNLTQQVSRLVALLPAG